MKKLKKIHKIKPKNMQSIREGHVYTVIDGKVVYMEDIVMNTPSGFYVKHINGDLLDNRKSNLELRPISDFS